jgi:hypothetical protein
MQLTDKQLQTVSVNLAKKIGGKFPPCSLCASTTWQTQRRLYELREFGGVTEGEGTAPALVIVCTTCGHTVLLSPLALGLKLKPAAG